MTANGKPRFAMYWAASCGGCDIAVLNLHEKVLDIPTHLDPVFWPVAMDTKYRDVEAMEDGSIALTFFSGGIRNTENAEIAHLLRRKSRLLIAFGSCACEGCIPGLANLSPVSELFATSYDDGIPSVNPDHVLPVPSWTAPEGELHLPTVSPLLRTLDQVVEVDYYVPGCPPESERIAEVVGLAIEALEGRATLPPRGSVLGAGTSTVCDQCARVRHERKLSRFARIQELPALDPALCLLEQGIPCNGSATRDGCGALCPGAGAPCIGCYGPADGVVDYGARLLSAFASLVDGREPDEIDRVLDGLPDPAGQFYRFSLARSLLRASRSAWAEAAGSNGAGANGTEAHGAAHPGAAPPAPGRDPLAVGAGDES